MTRPSRIRLTAPPLPYPRPAFDPRSRRFYTPRAFADWLDAAAWEFKALEPVTGEARLDVIVFPSGADVTLTPSDGTHPTSLRGDLDNYVKAVGDALQRSDRIRDDRQIVEITAAFASRKPR